MMDWESTTSEDVLRLAHMYVATDLEHALLRVADELYDEVADQRTTIDNMQDEIDDQREEIDRLESVEYELRRENKDLEIQIDCMQDEVFKLESALEEVMDEKE
jgi:predicted RNase H-like nuclease (RuvC/YqgF family)